MLFNIDCVFVIFNLMEENLLKGLYALMNKTSEVKNLLQNKDPRRISIPETLQSIGPGNFL